MIRGYSFSAQVMIVEGVYIHIPFCRKICPFCSFPVIRDKPFKHDEYLGLIGGEMSLLRRRLRLQFDRLRSVYVGGGTPSALSVDELGRLADSARSFFKLDSNARTQWSIEINPEDLSEEYAYGLKESGFSRVSLGVQSFQSQSLKTLGRAHTPEDSRSAVRILRQTGFKDINLDLMFGYPGQTLKSLKTDLQEFISQRPSHISAYCLNIEKKTAIYRKPEWSEWQEKNEDLIVEMSLQTAARLRANGLQRYEVSNFSKKGRRSLQNLINWKGRNYLGIGMGAHSFIFPFRWANYKRWAEYRNASRNNSPPVEYHEKLSPEQRRDEELMLRLRLTEGLDLSEFSLKHNLDAPGLWKTEIRRLEKLEALDLKENRLRLTDKGMLLADEITASLAALIKSRPALQSADLKPLFS